MLLLDLNILSVQRRIGFIRSLDLIASTSISLNQRKRGGAPNSKSAEKVTVTKVSIKPLGDSFMFFSFEEYISLPTVYLILEMDRKSMVW